MRLHCTLMFSRRAATVVGQPAAAAPASGKERNHEQQDDSVHDAEAIASRAGEPSDEQGPRDAAFVGHEPDADAHGMDATYLHDESKLPPGLSLWPGDCVRMEGRVVAAQEPMSVTCASLPLLTANTQHPTPEYRRGTRHTRAHSPVPSVSAETAQRRGLDNLHSPAGNSKRVKRA